jgi:PAS domain S-box-containing protein
MPNHPHLAKVSQNCGTVAQHTAASVRQILSKPKDGGQLDDRYFPLLLDVIDQCIFTIDPGGRITSFNRAAEELTGYTADEVMGHLCADIFRTEVCESGCPLRRTIRSGERMVDRRVRIRVKDGHSLPVSVTTALLCTDEGEVLGGVEVIKDLSSLMHLKRQLDGRYCFEDIISKNNKMHHMFELLPPVAQSDSSVLIRGASGTGKELVAKALHHQSNRRDRPFVPVNCAAMPETLMESELFGYIKGAFTDAKRDKPGRIAQADGGTLFLDEVGDLPLQVQVKLLRFLQERVYEPLGATFSTRSDVRIISATHRDLESMVEEGTFRQDLYYRLNIMQLHLPPLRDRPDDIPLLIQHFTRRFRHITGRKIEGMTDDALALLMRYSFPGNVRELENLIERAFILCEGPLIGVTHLPSSVLRRIDAAELAGGLQANRCHLNPIAEAEREAIVKALECHGGNRTHAAKELKIHRSTLIRKMGRLGIQ